jgi:uroporphyrinogen-III decarboxylase
LQEALNIDFKKEIEMTEKENYLKALKGETPDWIPVYWDACQWLIPSVFEHPMMTGKERNVYGIPYVMHVNGPMPRPNDFILKDISEWRTSVNIPTLEGYDWESVAKNDCAVLDKNKAVAVLIEGPFMTLVNSMGFEAGLMAMIEEPEEVMAFFEALGTFQNQALENTLKYYHPIDVVVIGDDVATVRDLFISPKTYREMILPFHKRLADIAKKYNMPIEMHCCGKCESLIDDWVSIGVSIWQPAQTVNDLAAIQKKYGKKLVINGGWDNTGPAGIPGADEKLIRQSARDTIDKLAPTGAFVFWDAGGVGAEEDMLQKLAWVQDEARKYGAHYYQKAKR